LERGATREDFLHAGEFAVIDADDNSASICAESFVDFTWNAFEFATDSLDIANRDSQQIPWVSFDCKLSDICVGELVKAFDEFGRIAIAFREWDASEEEVGLVHPGGRFAKEDQRFFGKVVQQSGFFSFDFIGSEEIDAIETLDGALGYSVEGSNRLDFVVKKFDAEGFGGVGWEDIEDATSGGIFSGHFDGSGCAVTDRFEPSLEFFEVNGMADMERFAVISKLFWTRNALHDGLER
jgi:hypothetical protein